MTLPPMKLDVKQNNDLGSGGGNPFDSMMPWNQTKIYNNHSDGANQNATSSASKAGGSDASGAGMLGGLNMNMLLLIAAALLILRR